MAQEQPSAPVVKVLSSAGGQPWQVAMFSEVVDYRRLSDPNRVNDIPETNSLKEFQIVASALRDF